MSKCQGRNVCIYANDVWSRPAPSIPPSNNGAGSGSDLIETGLVMLPFSSMGPKNTTSDSRKQPLPRTWDCAGVHKREGGWGGSVPTVTDSFLHLIFYCPRSGRPAVSASTCCMCHPPQLLQNKVFFLHQKEEKTEPGPHRPRPEDRGRQPTKPQLKYLHAR